MASKLIVVLALALVACVYAAPTTTEDTSETTTEQDVLLVEEIEVKEIPIIVAVIDPTTSEAEDQGTTSTSQPEHKVAKRAILDGENLGHDLLSNPDGIHSDDGLVDLDGRRIKFLPTWVG